MLNAEPQDDVALVAVRLLPPPGDLTEARLGRAGEAEELRP
jgi:hypothetical protein